MIHFAIGYMIHHDTTAFFMKATFIVAYPAMSTFVMLPRLPTAIQPPHRGARTGLLKTARSEVLLACAGQAVLPLITLRI